MKAPSQILGFSAFKAQCVLLEGEPYTLSKGSHSFLVNEPYLTT